MKAVFELGGKQHIRGEGEVFLCELVDSDVGDKFFVESVFSIINGDASVVGGPSVPGAKVELQVLHHGHDSKVRVQKYKPKINYRKVRGHKQPNSQVKLLKIHGGK